MDEVQQNIKYEVNVPYNHELLLASRKKAKKIAGITLLAALLFFIVLTIFAARSSSTVAILIFVIFDVVALGSCVYFWIPIKAKAKDDKRFFIYRFYEEGIQIFNNDETKETNKLKQACLYRPFKNKQYLKGVKESENLFELSVFTGTYNGAPQYSKYIIPKESFKDESEMLEFKVFMEEKLGNDYKVKQSKK